MEGVEPSWDGSKPSYQAAGHRSARARSRTESGARAPTGFEPVVSPLHHTRVIEKRGAWRRFQEGRTPRLRQRTALRGGPCSPTPASQGSYPNQRRTPQRKTENSNLSARAPHSLAGRPGTLTGSSSRRPLTRDGSRHLGTVNEAASANLAYPVRFRAYLFLLAKGDPGAIAARSGAWGCGVEPRPRRGLGSCRVSVPYGPSPAARRKEEDSNPCAFTPPVFKTGTPPMALHLPRLQPTSSRTPSTR